MPVQDSDIEALVRRLDLSLSSEETKTLARCFSGYTGQLAALHRLDLEGEEVGFAFRLPSADSDE